MKIATDDYKVWYETETATLNFAGLLRESSIADYTNIQDLLDKVQSENQEILTINLKNLEFLNSSGISILSRFVIGIRKQKTTQLIAKGLKGVIWQEKLFNNWSRLMPNLTIEWAEEQE